MQRIENTIIEKWYKNKGWTPLPFQLETWDHILQGYQGLLNAPTGSGKTYAIFFGVILDYLHHKEKYEKQGIKLIWITPIRALANELKYAMQSVLLDLNISWTVTTKTGDNTTKERNLFKAQKPDILITTPESLHIMLASKDYAKTLGNVLYIIADEWHELIGSKRGVLLELAIARIKALSKELMIWGISATIANMEEAMRILLGTVKNQKEIIISAAITKQIEVLTILPDEIEKMPWAGHFGIHLLHKVLPIIEKSNSTLIFTNTRAMSEIWYQKILETMPDLAGLIALHHGSIDGTLRNWVEENLHEGTLKAVVCTSSLDLGVDFHPVDTIIQIGSPKGIARFMQRAGRSGHRPNAISQIYFLPTHSLEIIESTALQYAIKNNIIEPKQPIVRAMDVLVQYLLTLAVSDGFDEAIIYDEIIKTYCYESITKDEWRQLLFFIISGGAALNQYNEYKKIEVIDNVFRVIDSRIAQRHRLSIGTIVSEQLLHVRWTSGGRLGNIEEYFISRLNTNDVFWFAGRSLELVQIKNLDVLVKKSNKLPRNTPSWQGGRMPLSAQLSLVLKNKITEAVTSNELSDELLKIKPLLELQKRLSHLPSSNELLVEIYHTKEGYHILLFPFEGRLVHEAMASLMSYRMSMEQPITISMAYTDYGLELLIENNMYINETILKRWLRLDNLTTDLLNSVNASEMAGRRFRDIAAIAGLTFKGFPGKIKKERHLQASASLIFKVMQDYDKENLLLKQAYEETLLYQMEETRLRNTLTSLLGQHIIIKTPDHPSPFAFPIMVDRMRQNMTTETIESRIQKMNIEWSTIANESSVLNT